MIFEIFNISENNIINVELVKVLGCRQKMLELRIRCMRFENVCSCNTHSTKQRLVEGSQEKKDKVKLKFNQIGANMSLSSL